MIHREDQDLKLKFANVIFKFRNCIKNVLPNYTFQKSKIKNIKLTTTKALLVVELDAQNL